MKWNWSTRRQRPAAERLFPIKKKTETDKPKERLTRLPPPFPLPPSVGHSIICIHHTIYRASVLSLSSSGKDLSYAAMSSAVCMVRRRGASSVPILRRSVVATVTSKRTNSSSSGEQPARSCMLYMLHVHAIEVCRLRAGSTVLMPPALAFPLAAGCYSA